MGIFPAKTDHVCTCRSRLLRFLGLALVCCLSCVYDISAQAEYVLKINEAEGRDHLLHSIIPPDSVFIGDSLEQMVHLNTLIDSLRNDAYLAASVDEVVIQSDTLLAVVHIGIPYQWGMINVNAVDPVFLKGIHPEVQRMMSQPVNYDELSRVMAGIITNAENQGYPFASIRMTELISNGDTLFAGISMTPGRLVSIDSIMIRGNAQVNPDMLGRYLDIERNSLFSRERLLDIPRKIRELPYLVMTGNPEIRFIRDKAIIILDLQRKSASKFDFLLGVLPRREVGQRAVISGSFLADIRNQFALGERIFVQFERLRPRTQNLELEVDFPFIPVIPFGVEASFSLFKNDTLYTQLRSQAGLLYALSRKTELSAFLDWHSSSLISIRRQQLLQTLELPENLDLRVRGVGLGVHYTDLDYRFNPRRGQDIEVRATASLRKIQRNNEILDLEDENSAFKADSLYDALELISEQYLMLLNGAYYLPVGRRSTLKLGCQAAALIASGMIFANELFRIGGVQTLRGFDEESVFADRYAVLTGEYRLFLGQNSYLAAFADYGFIRNRLAMPILHDQPYGFGAGITFETRAGIFGLSVAFGARKENPVNLRAAKVHFGYVNVF